MSSVVGLIGCAVALEYHTGVVLVMGCASQGSSSFNDFSDEYPDLREDEATKEELHLRTDTLSDKLWDISEE